METRIETTIAELTDFLAPAEPPVDEETIEYMAEQLVEHGLTLETCSVDQLNNLMCGEDINAWR
ncbi:hypothetical protein [Rothia sp. ZJ932]|uniref:hypothetical protein n=1 Tax=Rothia sp. ZJ932 TaxID=2810516 RepID=UPI001968792F|nr:hypothetical protein [Rothia sp. ZJ932]QRZ61816.1 hypothetical protein JR346_01340 [Rothia sp. ZJ932]